MAIEDDLPWPTLTKQTLNRIGVSTENNINNIGRAAPEKTKEIYYQNSFKEINSEGSKL